MKRDMDLVRKILLKLEEEPSGYAPKVNIEGYNAEQIGFHVFLMMQAGLVLGNEFTSFDSNSPVGEASSITWQGYEFLEAARDKTRWEKAKGVFNQIGGMTLEALKQTLQQQMIEQATKLLS